MGMILLLENHAGDASNLISWLHEDQGGIRDQREVLVKYPDFRLKDYGLSDIEYNEIDLILLDLELGKKVSNPPGDLFGKDRILPYLRNLARWIPVICLSGFLGSDRTVAKISTTGFDGLVSKNLFTSELFIPMWLGIENGARLNRIAALTGRGVIELQHSLKSTGDPIWGEIFEQQVDQIGKDEFVKLLSLLGLSEGRTTIDHIHQGFSGAVVARAYAPRGSDTSCWLVKASQSPGKLDREIRRHREVFLDGVSRRLTVPPVWWAPIATKGGAIIAYEFEQNSRTLLEEIRDSHIEIQVALESIRPALSSLYSGLSGAPIVPSHALRSYFKNLRSHEELPEKAIPNIFASKTPNEALGQAVILKHGCQHGDLHASNILISDLGPALIDFAHYLSRASESDMAAIPLIDLAKLACDFWVNGIYPQVKGLLTGEDLTNPVFHPIVDLFTLKQQPNEDEIQFFGMANQCHLARYLDYPGIPDDVREAIVGAFTDYYDG